jgi:hypothetical protein
MLSFYVLPVVERRAGVRLTQERYNPAALPGSFWAASPAMLLVLSGTIRSTPPDVAFATTRH